MDRPTPSATLVLDRARREGAKPDARCQMILETLQTVSAVETRLRCELAQAGLTPTGFSLLAALSSHEPEPVLRVDLSEQTQLSGAMLEDALGRLESSQLVERFHAASGNRLVSYRLTPAGRERIDSALRQYVTGVLHATQFLDESTIKACLENAQALRRGSSAFE